MQQKSAEAFSSPFGPARSPTRAIERYASNRQTSNMRVNLITLPFDRSQATLGNIPLMLTISPACGIPGDYECPTDVTGLLRILRLQTDLPLQVLQHFEDNLYSARGARLLGVELNDRILTNLGYFID
jgi:hypothetical protein